MVIVELSELMRKHFNLKTVYQVTDTPFELNKVKIIVSCIEKYYIFPPKHDNINAILKKYKL